MPDADLRALERSVAEGDLEAIDLCNRARARVGLKPFKRKIVHYVPADKHDRVNRVGKISKQAGYYWGQQVVAPCSVELYPRDTYRKRCYFTIERSNVTCKTCLGSLNSKNPKTRPFISHLARASQDGSVALCGRPFDKLTDVRLQVTCQACVRIMGRRRKNNTRERRRLRRQSDPFRHGMA